MLGHARAASPCACGDKEGRGRVKARRKGIQYIHTALLFILFLFLLLFCKLVVNSGNQCCPRPNSYCVITCWIHLVSRTLPCYCTYLSGQSPPEQAEVKSGNSNKFGSVHGFIGPNIKLHKKICPQTGCCIRERFAELCCNNVSEFTTLPEFC